MRSSSSAPSASPHHNNSAPSIPGSAIRWAVAAVVTAAVISLPLAAERSAAEDDRSGESPDQVADFMRAKLNHSVAVLEGLAIEDYMMMAKSAQDLALASQASSWQVLQTEEYARQSAEFRRSCITLRDAAKAENLDAAALAWMDVTMKCVQCHRYVRDAQ
jgi:hypothetical protein